MASQINVIDEGKIAETTGDRQSVQNTLTVDSDDGDNSRLGLAFRVSSALQTTLEIDQLIELFSHQISPAIPHNGTRYEFKQAGIDIQIKDTKAKHICNYRLLLNGESLGEMTLYRDWEFSEAETKVFEYTLCSLVYPLRNAAMYREALHAAHKDPLTGVNNRSTFDETLTRETHLARRYDKPLSLIVLDIDHFKKVNDTLGHSAGDCVIRATAERTATIIRRSDILFRYGGEEFVVLLSNTNSKGAALLARRICKAIEKTESVCNGNKISVTVSLGVATLQADEDGQAFFARADAALYGAKQGGRNCVHIAEAIKEDA